MQFSVKGSGFDEIPDDAVAIIDGPNNPLYYRNSNDPWVLMQIVSKTDTLIEFSASEEFYFGTEHSLGAILTANRETVIWVKS